MNKILIWGALLLILFGAVYYFRPKPEVVNYPSSGSDIIAFGDSLVSGVGSEGGGFVTELSRELGREIVNLGVPGDTTKTALERVSQLDLYNPKVVIVLLGGNDFLRKVHPDETFANLDDIIDEVQKRGAIALLLGVRSGLLGDRYNDRFEDLAKAKGAAYVPDVLKGIFGKDEFMYDSIHPNEKGYALIAEKVLLVLESLAH